MNIIYKIGSLIAKQGVKLRKKGTKTVLRTAEKATGVDKIKDAVKTAKDVKQIYKTTQEIGLKKARINTARNMANNKAREIKSTLTPKSVSDVVNTGKKIKKTRDKANKTLNKVTKWDKNKKQADAKLNKALNIIDEMKKTGLTVSEDYLKNIEKFKNKKRITDKDLKRIKEYTKTSFINERAKVDVKKFLTADKDKLPVSIKKGAQRKIAKEIIYAAENTPKMTQVLPSMILRDLVKNSPQAYEYARANYVNKYPNAKRIPGANIIMKNPTDVDLLNEKTIADALEELPDDRKDFMLRLWEQETFIPNEERKRQYKLGIEKRQRESLKNTISNTRRKYGIEQEATDADVNAVMRVFQTPAWQRFRASNTKYDIEDFFRMTELARTDFLEAANLNKFASYLESTNSLSMALQMYEESKNR